jgi:hypothetical protein
MASVSLTSPYKTKSGKPWLRNSWVVYLDILGFSAQVKSATEAGTPNELLLELTTALEEAKVDLVVDPDDYARYGILEAPYAVKMFTDNVVLGFPIRDDGEGEFGRMIYIVGLWQYSLLKHGFFVRGGMTVGPIYMDDDVAFGKGLLDAYEAESTLARDPRVVLAPSAMDLVHHHLAYYANVSESPQNFTLLVDSDSQMFVNYLYLPIDGEDGLPEEFASDIEQHRDLITSRLKEFSGNPTIWSKYAWAGSYHNHFCDHYPGLAHLKIDSALLVQAPRFLSQLYTRKGNKMLRDGKEVATFKYVTEWKVEKKPE